MKHRRPERAADEAKYRERAKEFLKLYPVCPILLWKTGGKVQTTELHHCKRRDGALLLDQRFWLAVSAEGHRLCEQTAPMQMRMMGFNLSRGFSINDQLEERVLAMRRNLDFSDVKEYSDLMKAIYPEYITT